MATFEFKLPDIGEGVVEGEIVKWLVKAGDVITEDQPLLEVMTDKATVTIPSPKAGTVIRTHGREGEVAKVHHLLVELEMQGGAEATPQLAPSPKADVATKSAAVAASVPSQISSSRVLATPVTRRMASEHHIDLSIVTGTGPNGRVLKADVESLLSQGGSGAVATAAVQRTATVPLASSGLDQRIPIRGLRKKIAEKMVKSKFTAPHYAFVEEVDVSNLVSLRTGLNEQLKDDGLKLSFLPFIVKAVIAAFRKFPQVNSNMDEAAQELIVRGDRNIGIAAMTEQGLMVPVLRGSDRLSVRQIGSELIRLSEAARNQKLKMDELTGGTFTITSLGQTGGLFATPIINHPEVAIMGVHRMRKKPIVDENDQITIRPMMYCSFCFDHRVIDGATGAEFAYEVLKFIERPELLLVDSI